MALMLSALCLFAGFVLLALQLAWQWRARQRVARRLQGRMARDERLGDWLQWLGSSPLGRRLQRLDGETQALLDRLGWRRSRQRALFAAVQLGLPLLAMIVVLVMVHGLPGSGAGIGSCWCCARWAPATCCPSACWRLQRRAGSGGLPGR